MSTLGRAERIKFEKLFGMQTGYVVDFSNRTFQDFIFESVGIDVYHSRFDIHGTSKANHLRAFWELEPDVIVAKFMRDMLAHWNEYNNERFYSPTPAELTLFSECEKTLHRLSSNAPVDNLDAIKTSPDDKNITELALSIRESINSNKPEVALDRLHTYVTKYLRSLCDKHGLEIDKSKPLHSLMGEYIKCIKGNGLIESEMAERILKSSISILEAFNDVRNNRSLAHDNIMLSYQESLLVFNHITGAIKFIESVEYRAIPTPEAPKQPEFWDEIPF